MAAERGPPGCRYQFRVAALGDAAVGKTALLRRFVAGAAGSLEPGPERAAPTAGVECYGRALRLPAGPRVKLQLWDTAGQERFRCVTRSFYRNVVGVLLVFDVTNRKSFEHIPDWHQEVLAAQGPHRAIFLLLGHKSDLESARCVSAQEAEALAASLGVAFMETSAVNNCNVDLAFQTLATAIQQALQQGDIKLEEGWGALGSSTGLQSPGPPAGSLLQAHASVDSGRKRVKTVPTSDAGGMETVFPKGRWRNLPKGFI